MVLPSKARKLDRSLDRLRPDAVYYGTLHAAKGLEFDSVLIARCSTDRLPDPSAMAALGAEEGRAEDLRLLYVGVTRPRMNLFISFCGKKTDLLPDDPKLFERKSVR